MFNYPPTLLIHASDKLVSELGSSPTMHSGADAGTREEKREFMLAKIPWLKFPKFDSTSGPLQWIHRCECYFCENKRVVYVAFHLLDGAQLWYHRLPSGSPTRGQFVLLITACFRPQITLDGGSSTADIPGGGALFMGDDSRREEPQVNLDTRDAKVGDGGCNFPARSGGRS
jgi:hypothetical protein